MATKSSTITSVAFVSLGCPKNLVDSERMLGLLAQEGIAISADAADADAIVINTCGFLEASKVESLGEIRRAVELKRSGHCKRVVVAGCLVQRHKTSLLDAVPEIDRLVGVFDREHIVDAVRGKENPRQAHGHFLGKYHDLSNELHKAPGSSVGLQKKTKTSRLPVFENDRAELRLTPRHYAYLRISEGCNQGCTFCTIPSIRGPMRSKPIEQILLEAKELAADGAVELNLIGQDTTSYGTDIGYAPGLSGLLKTLDRKLPDVHWLRLMYAYPSCFTDEMIKTIADCGRVVKYIDMPLQHINDQMLASMRRRVTRKDVEALLGKLRRWVPGIAIRTTFIAGAPGETEAQHQELVQFVKDFDFDMMGVFGYSQESGTPMGRMTNQVSPEVKQQRVEELMLAQQQMAFAKAESMIGKKVEVLIDSKSPVGVQASAGMSSFVARTQSQAPDIDGVMHLGGRDLHPGQLVNARISDYQAYDLVGEVVLSNRSRELPVLASTAAS